MSTSLLNSCWRAADPGAIGVSSLIPLVCVTPTNLPSAVQVATIRNDTVVARDTIDASGASGAKHALNKQGCAGSESARWSTDSRRLYLRSDVTCAGGLERTGTGVFAISPTGEWLDVQGMQAGGLKVVDIGEPIVQTDTAVTQAWIVERHAQFKLGVNELTELADAGIPGSVTDVMVGISYPDHFALQQLPMGPGPGSNMLWPRDSARIASEYLNDRHRRARSRGERSRLYAGNERQHGRRDVERVVRHRVELEQFRLDWIVERFFRCVEQRLVEWRTNGSGASAALTGGGVASAALPDAMTLSSSRHDRRLRKDGQREMRRQVFRAIDPHRRRLEVRLLCRVDVRHVCLRIAVDEREPGALDLHH
jgi:hypothetical protein